MPKQCKCGCGTELKPADRKRTNRPKGSYATYIRGHKGWNNGICPRGHKKTGQRCILCNQARIRAKKYGITFEEALAVPERCYSCGKKRKLDADHNHRTGKFRGWLCHRCNRGLGFFDDNVKMMRKAIKYLELYDG